MLVSVTERTREIGTRKALGARNFHIRFQFLTEAVIITAIGGMIGIALGTLIGISLSLNFNAPITISIPVIVGSAAFSMVIGIFFGLYPANSAAKLDPIEALRYE
jgi:putative ABC transport system permease protein